MPRQVAIEKTINQQLPANSSAIIPILDNSSPEYSGIITKSIQIKDILVFTRMSSLPPVNVPFAKLNDSIVDKNYRTLAIENSSPRKQLNIYLGENGEFKMVGVVNLINYSGYPYRIVNLLAFFSDKFGTTIEDGFSIGLSIEDTGDGLLTSDDLVVVHGSYSMEYLLQDSDLVLPIAISDVALLQQVLTSKADTIHGHSINQIEDLSTSLAAKASTNHSHIINDINDLSTVLNGKANNSHIQEIGTITGLATALSNAATVVYVDGLITVLNNKINAISVTSSTVPNNPFPGQIWHEVSSANQLVEDWIYLNSSWYSLHTYQFDFPSPTSFQGGFNSLFLPLDHRYQYFFTELSTYCDYNGALIDANNYFKVVVWMTSDNTVTIVADTGALPNSEFKTVVPINAAFSPTNKEFVEHRTLKTGNAPGTRIASSLKYRLIRK
ncbi:hypothetical protein [Brunnivagina elsteri]|uniref:Uncharacterized protein n=1 Tax=Brunnivagina elsteri CCALA 953 TaxID=987040 RepID=A0A2A2TE52_9CYAN|nr:hypothetical protein [Calothrix elsteri]PAX52012.1 hypothetical protein CK510_21655 [Calothrix elsteri CCALA 953]